MWCCLIVLVDVPDQGQGLELTHPTPTSLPRAELQPLAVAWITTHAV